MIRSLRTPWLLVGLVLAAELALAPPAHAQWQPDGVPVCTATGNQTKAVVVSDGSGGAYVVWEDARGADPQIYAQHLNALGVRLWQTNGMLVSSGSWPQYGPVAVGDGEGGVFIAWILSLVPGAYEGRGQRLNSTGVPYWAQGGIPITPGAALPTKLVIIGDDRTPTGGTPAGIIVAWTDARPGPTTDIYIQAVSGTGTARWGTAVCTATGNQIDLRMVSDAFSSVQGQPRGAILAWRDYRAGLEDPDIYSQRIDHLGTPVWTVNGIDLAPSTTSVQEPAIAPAGSQNAIVCWPGPVPGRTFGLFADRVGSAGSWGGSVPLTNPASSQAAQAVRGDLTGGLIVTWDQFGQNLTRDVYAQRLDATGAPQWGATGKLVCVSSSIERSPQIVPGASGSSVIVWLDSRNESARDIYAQVLDANGARQWLPEGTPICRAVGMQTELSACPESTGGAIVGWTDYRNGDADIYAQRVTGAGGVTGVDGTFGVTLRLSPLWPNPSSSGVQFAFDLPATSAVSATVFDAAGRHVRTMVRGEMYRPGHHTLAWDGTGGDGMAAARGVYWIRVDAGGEHASKRAVILR